MVKKTEFRLLRGVGHVPMADDPELVSFTIRDFANRAEAADTGLDQHQGSHLDPGEPGSRL